MSVTTESTISLGKPVAGAPDLVPALTVKGVVPIAPDGSRPSCFLGAMDSDRLADLSFVPAADYVESTLNIRSKGGYQTPPAESDIDAAVQILRLEPGRTFAPPILSGRGRWVCAGKRPCKLQIFDAAAILRGHLLVAGYRRLTDAGEPPAEVPFIVFPSIAVEEERVVYAIDQSTSAGGDINGGESRSPRRHDNVLTIGTAWVEVQIESEPFIARVGRGYAPAILVREFESQAEKIIYASSKSLSLAIEGVRARRGGLVGAIVQIRKSGDDRYATYDVIERDSI